MAMIPNAFYYPREKRLIQEMAQWGKDNDFTHIIVLSEKQKQCDG